MVSSLIFVDQECALVDTWYFVRLTPIGNSQINLGKSWYQFKSKIEQGTWWTPITLHKEDTAHPSWMEDLWVSKFIHFVFCYKLLLPWTMLECSGQIKFVKKHDKQNLC